MEIVSVNAENLSQHPGAICFINSKNPSYTLKTEWLQKRFSEGLRIKLLYTEDRKKVAGFIEYVPGEFAWRAVSAVGYMFIHCLWVYPNENKNKGFGTQLIEACIEDARQNNYKGVAVITSKNAFMANNSLFIKNNFREIANDGAGNELLTFSFKDDTLPSINDWKKQLATFQGLHMVYSKQCPWVARMVEEIKESELAKKLGLQITELKTPADAQNAPSLYSVFNLINNGKLLSDRYISITRFNNILKKEKLI
jgi:ribosomal protein S18 acetylase RimI-like enzyme